MNEFSIQKLDVNNEGRRDFLKNSALVAAGLFFGSSITSSAFSGQGNIKGSRISSISLIDDCLRLISLSEEIPPLFKKIINPDLHAHVSGNTARLGGVMPLGKNHVAELLSIARKGLEEENKHFADEKLALALGVLAANAYQKEFNSKSVGIETGLYLDAVILKDMQGLDAYGAMPGNPNDLADMFQEMVPRFLTRVHTTIPDDDDAQGWILKLDKWRGDLYDYFKALAKVYLKPDKKKVDQLVVKPKLYISSDHLIKLARNIQNNKASNVTDVSSLLDKVSGQSLYGRALAHGCKSLIAAGKLYEAKMDEDSFNKVINS